jgi:hypothetical protein
VQAENAQKAIGSKRADEDASMALQIVDKLTANGSVHLIPVIGQIVNLHRRAIFAEAVGQDAILRFGAAKIWIVVAGGL